MKAMGEQQPGVRIGGGKSDRHREIDAEWIRREREWIHVTAARYALEAAGAIVDRDPGDEQ